MSYRPHAPPRSFALVALAALAFGGCLDDTTRDYDAYLDELEERGLYDPGELPEGIVPVLCTASQGPSRDLSFVNQTGHVLEYEWVNAACEAITYGEIARDGERTQSTYEGHVWRFRIRGTDRVLHELAVAASDPDRIVVTWPR